MTFIAIVGNYQKYGAYGICLGGKTLNCLQSDCGGSELTSKKLRSLLMIAVSEVSTTNGIPSVSHEDGFSSGKPAVEKILICKVGIGLCCFRRRLSRWTNIFYHTLKIYMQREVSIRD